MNLAIIAAVLHGTAYCIYVFQVYGGDSVPNPASWTVWMILATLNALTFWKGSKSALATAQFFTGAVASAIVWAYSLVADRFTPLDTMGWIVLLSCLIVIIIWKSTGKATYANIVIGIILIVSFVPTVLGVWKDPSVEEALPWGIWTLAFLATTINGFRRRREEHEVDWRLMLFVPVTMLFAHGIVGILAEQ